ncbi:MAG: nucleotidyltransferase [Bacteroidia bacterium]|nr:nucleotidyltransferase [Bacteroidia bacterium]MCF8426613.1 nucleotidyltransferase [Bacteroidia bacterium]
MDIFLESHKSFLILLLKHRVEFILIGGYAVIIYGYERGTSDMDLWLKPTNENKEKFIVALREYGISEAGIMQLNSIDFAQDVKVFHIGEKPNKIDFLTRVQGLKFEEADNAKKLLPLKEFHIPVIQYEHLILVKMIAGRPQDMADIDVLRKINKDRN